MFESRFIGRKLTEQTVQEAQHFVVQLVQARQHKYEMPEYVMKMMEEAKIDEESKRKMLYGDWDMSEKKPVPHKIAPSNAYHSSSDIGRCPHCYANGNQVFLGTLSVDGIERPTYHCTSCNKAYAEMPASIKVIADAAVQDGAKQVGFVPATSAPNVASPTQQFDYTLQNNTQQTNYKLDQVSSNISSLTCTIQDLMEQVRTLAEQNNKMMHQLATDPLISVRKAVSEFNLK